MTFNPLLPLDYCLLLGVALLVVALLAAWRSAHRARPATRATVTVLRALVVVVVVALLANPGSWQQPPGSGAPRWTVLLDRSQSMDTPDVDGGKRWEAGRKLAHSAAKLAGGAEEAEWATAGEQLAVLSLAELDAVVPDAQKSDVIGAVHELLSRHAGAPEGLAGILVLSDGAQLPEVDPAPVAMQARAMGVPIWAIPLGGPVVPANLEITPMRRHLTGFAGQEVVCLAEVDSQNLPATALAVTLEDGVGQPLASQRVEVPAGGRVTVRLVARLPETAGLYRWRVSAPLQPDERIAVDNRADIGVSVLAGNVRVLLVEGTPGWDSKFLARVLRKQPHMEVSELYRLGSSRTQWLGPEGEPTDLPADQGPLADGFAGFDVVTCGRDVTQLLDDAQFAELRRFAFERGGCVLFARGRPTRRAPPDFAALFPVEWQELADGPLRWQPTAAGQRLGLFGERLPSGTAEVWGQLPSLNTVSACAERLPPFAAVLAEAVDPQGVSRPLLVSRRVGLGLSVAFNGGDFWQWDFFPQSPKSKEVYQAFWPQLLQWMLSYAEFLPGQPLALRLSRDVVRPGETVGIHVVARRGTEPGRIRLRVRGPGDGAPVPLEAQRTDDPDVAARAAQAFSEPGLHQVEAYLVDGDDTLVARAPVQVLAPPPEPAHRSADPDFLRRLAEGSGGKLVAADGLTELPRRTVVEAAPGELVWRPAWDRLWVLLGLAALLGGEWIIRRRSAVP